MPFGVSFVVLKPVQGSHSAFPPQSGSDSAYLGDAVRVHTGARASQRSPLSESGCHSNPFLLAQKCFCAGNAYFSSPRVGADTAFVIKHYAGAVKCAAQSPLRRACAMLLRFCQPRYVLQAFCRNARVLLQCVSKGLLLIRYVVEGFREKNKDALHPDLVSLLEGAMTSELLRHSDIW